MGVHVRRHARVEVVVLVGGHKRGAAPVDLDAAPACRPLVPVPNAGEDVHRLLVRERHARCLIVGEYADGQVVYQESAETERPTTHQLKASATYFFFGFLQLNTLIRAVISRFQRRCRLVLAEKPSTWHFEEVP